LPETPETGDALAGRLPRLTSRPVRPDSSRSRIASGEKGVKAAGSGACPGPVFGLRWSPPDSRNRRCFSGACPGPVFGPVSGLRSRRLRLLPETPETGDALAGRLPRLSSRPVRPDSSKSRIASVEKGVKAAGSRACPGPVFGPVSGLRSRRLRLLPETPETGDASAGPAPEASAGPAPEASAGPAPEASAGPAPDGSAGPAPDGSAGPAPEASAGCSPNLVSQFAA